MGCQECADRIFACAQVKPVVGFVNAFCASAAYWLAAQSNLLLMMPSGQVGSVGVVTQHVDYSEANKMEGAKVTYLTSDSAPFKAEGNRDEPLSDDAAAYTLKTLNAYHDKFAAALARGRRVSVNTVNATFGGGRVKGSADALASKMICGLESTLLAVIARAVAGEGKPKSPSATAEGRRAILARQEAENAALEARIAAYDVQHGGTLTVAQARAKMALLK